MWNPSPCTQPRFLLPLTWYPNITWFTPIFVWVIVDPGLQVDSMIILFLWTDSDQCLSISLPGGHTFVYLHHSYVFCSTCMFTDQMGFSVSLPCRDALARTRGLPACGEVNLPQMRPPCELREPSDTRLLLQMASVSGSREVCPRVAFRTWSSYQ